MSEIYVIGHRNPDTDAICSSIGYADKRRTGMPEAVAARCGDTNDRIDFVLNTFGFESPLSASLPTSGVTRAPPAPAKAKIAMPFGPRLKGGAVNT